MADAIKTPVQQSMIQRALGAFNVLTGKAVPVVDDGKGWMGPLNPIQPVVPEGQDASVRGRQFDFQVGANMQIRPRSNELVTFEQMRALADSCDILRLVIETRKDQMSKMAFSVKPIKDASEKDPRCEEVEAFLKLPDGENSWHEWLRQLLEEVMVTDAACIYPVLTNGGKPYSFDLLDGTTIKRVIDEHGRTPQLPLPAYQQVLKGVIAANYTRDELVYVPRNRRVHKLYGQSPVEQIVMTVNTAIRRSLHQLQFYTDGSAPDLLFQVPPDWNMTQIKEFNDWWQDSLAGNTGTRRKAQFVPDGVKPVNLKDGILKDEYDEWLARIICYAFSVSPQAFVKSMNRATGQTAQEMALQEGLHPLMLWVKSVVDRLIWQYFGYADLEFVWKDQDATAVTDQNVMDDRNVKNGTSTINEIRAKRGDAPIPGGDEPMVLTATGYVPVIPAPVVAEPVGNDAPIVATGPLDEAAKKKADDAASGGTYKILKAAKKPKKIKPLTPDNSKREKELAKGIRGIFANQLASIREQLTKADKSPIEGIDFSEWEAFNDLFKEQLILTATNGVDAAYAQINLDNPEALTIANQNAIDWAKDRSAELVGKRVLNDGTIIDNPNASYNIDEATREFLRSDVAQAMGEGWSNDELADALSENYGFSDARAETIARTETANADVQGNVELYKASGEVASKQWLTGAGCCDECDELNEEIAPLEGTFANGADAPPLHPNCRCAILPILSTEEDQ